MICWQQKKNSPNHWIRIEGFLSCGPLIQTEIDPSVTPNSALFSWWSLRNWFISPQIHKTKIPLFSDFIVCFVTKFLSVHLLPWQSLLCEVPKGGIVSIFVDDNKDYSFSLASGVHDSDTILLLVHLYVQYSTAICKILTHICMCISIQICEVRRGTDKIHI